MSYHDVSTDALLTTAEVTPQKRRTTSSLLTWAVVLVTLLAFFLRTHQLYVTPPGFNYDEAAHALDATEILQGKHIVWSDRSGGNPALLKYLIAGFFAMLGARPFSQRLLIAFLSTATVPALYLLARTMFAQLGLRRAQLIGLLAALGLATSFWHINHSRMGLEFSPALLFEVLGFYFLWRGLLSGKLWPFAASGAWLGAALYIYPTARFVPVLVLAFWAYLCLSRQYAGTESGLLRSGIGQPNGSFVIANGAKQSQLNSATCNGTAQNDTQEATKRFGPSPRGQFSLWALTVLFLSMAVVFAPVGVHFILHPADFFSRAQDTYFLNPVVSQGRPWARLLEGILTNLGAFGLTTDSDALANLEGRSLLEPVPAFLFWLGLVLSLRHAKRPPYAFCAMWWAILMLPIFLTPDRLPHFSRLLTVAPVTYLFTAVALDGIVSGLGRLASRLTLLRTARQWVFAVALVSMYGTIVVGAYQDYFLRWAQRPNTSEDFHVPMVELAEMMNADHSSEAVYVLSCSGTDSACTHYTLDFCHRQGPSHRVIRIDEAKVAPELTQAAVGGRFVDLVQVKTGKERFQAEISDPKRILQFLLERFGAVEAMRAFAGYDIITYRLPSRETDFTEAIEFAASNLSFGGQLRLESLAFGDASGDSASAAHTVRAGGHLWAIMNWRALSQMQEDYKASLRLVDQAGQRVAQVDHFLLDSHYNRTHRWPVGGETVQDYYLLEVPARVAPGVYGLELVVYTEVRQGEALDFVQLPVDGTWEVSVKLGEVQVLAPSRAT